MRLMSRTKSPSLYNPIFSLKLLRVPSNLRNPVADVISWRQLLTQKYRVAHTTRHPWASNFWYILKWFKLSTQQLDSLFDTAAMATPTKSWNSTILGQGLDKCWFLQFSTVFITNKLKGEKLEEVAWPHPFILLMINSVAMQIWVTKKT